MTASDVPWRMRICQHFGINAHPVIVSSDGLGEFWANSCSHCEGVVRPMWGDESVMNWEGMGMRIGTPFNISVIPRREPTCLIRGSLI